MKLISKAQEALMKNLCPKYLSQFPNQDKQNDYVVEVRVFKGRNTFGDHSELIASERVTGLFSAYKRVRWMALKADLKLGSGPGIAWRIYDPLEANNAAN